jgi:hypothetical protein
MSPSEIDAVLISEVSAVESRLYMYLRRHMDYRTGVVGHPRRISYQSIREHLEYLPERGSTVKPFSPSNQQINRLLRKLESRGFIERLHDGSQLKEAMLFRMLLAVTDLNRPNEERQRSDTRAPTRQSPINTGAESVMSDKGATREERHTSVTSDIKTRERTRASDSAQLFAGRDLTITEPMKAIFFRKFGVDPNRLENEFTSFQLHKSNKSTMRSLRDWQDEWQRWIARSKIMNPSTTAGPSGGQTYAQRKRNSTSEILDLSRKYAEQAAAGRRPDDDDD